MKSKFALLALLAASVLPASATVTLNTSFGTAFNSAGVAVPDGTLWALVVDTNNDSSFMGQFGTNSSLNASGADILFNTGDSIGLGTVLGGDTVFAMGGFNSGDGASYDAVVASLGTNGVAQGLKFSFVWFPGVIYTVEGNYTVGLEVGAIHSNVNAATLGDLVIPADGNLVNVGAGTPAASGGVGGTMTPAQFTAVQIIPEPTTALLGAIGALGLLRRRR